MPSLRSRVPACLLAVATLAALASATPASAEPAVPDGTSLHVTVTLRSRDPARLAAAVRAGATATEAQRRAALAAAAPAAGVRARVERWLADRGFTVTEATGWAVTAEGTAGQARNAFGVGLRPAGNGRFAPDRAVGVPAELRADVLAVSGLDTRARWTHRAIPVGYDGADLKAAYDVVAPGSDGAGTTVATVQFSGWNKSDLTTYAAAAGVTLTSGNPAQVSVNGADPAVPDAGGEFEVALDQEVLLATAPKAQQRIYFAPNDTGSAVALYAKIADEVVSKGIDVVSTSWGLCEPILDQFAVADRAAMETHLAAIVAAGATVFAASGDLGAYDCSSEEDPDTILAVDFPASSTSAVAVGGTNLTGSGTNWTETAWNWPGTGGFAGYASGGGQSSSIARPSWQSSIAISGTKRLVPDVAAVADPDTGIGVYVAGTDADGWVLGGGTSASAPLWAGQLASALSAYCRSTGIGDVHAALYANPSAFRDVTSGTNFGFNAGAGYDQVTGLGTPTWSALGPALIGGPKVCAPYGVNTTTVPLTVSDPNGMGFTSYEVGEGNAACSVGGTNPTPPTSFTFVGGSDRVVEIVVAATLPDTSCVKGRTFVRYDTHAPTATLTVKPQYSTPTARTLVSWGGSDPSLATSGIESWKVEVRQSGVTATVWSRAATTTRSVGLNLNPGWTYRISVSAVDRAGNRGSTVSTSYAVPLDDGSFSRSSGWVRRSSSSAWYGAFSASATKGARLSRSVSAKRYDLILTAVPTGGYVDVYVNGTFVRRVDTYRSSTLYRKVVTVASYSTKTARTIMFKVVGAHNGSSKGNNVYVDGVRAIY